MSTSLSRLRDRGHVEDDWRARPVGDKRWPVVLLHGSATTAGDLAALVRFLRTAGWVVFTPEYGRRATRAIEDSASQVAAYIDQVLHATGCTACVIVAHSQGGLVARWYMKNLGGRDKVHHLVCLGSPNHGTSLGGMLSGLVTGDTSSAFAEHAMDFYFGAAGRQQLRGSRFLEQLNHPEEVLAGVGYTCVATKTDATIRPPSSCFLSPPGGGDSPAVTNFYVQDIFPLYPASHGDLVRDRQVHRIVRDVLEQVACRDCGAGGAGDNHRPPVLLTGLAGVDRRYLPPPETADAPGTTDGNAGTRKAARKQEKKAKKAKKQADKDAVWQDWV
ncbi:triacylglycerol lipase [Corynebacterium sp. CCM 8862]|uniref:Triacylglycerol lipase n=2 Tax=Corynebacterium mendelii TaxID=2765362 RepID=A0A939E214_9CORY|nr:alpha/beta fold hydrolase [Corynebacterium mendelii]MBN9645056.1 triacylglycerol lipase [Corynebacterium mendelii]